jgi:hypothetical protein
MQNLFSYLLTMNSPGWVSMSSRNAPVVHISDLEPESCLAQDSGVTVAQDDGHALHGTPFRDRRYREPTH